MQHSKSIREVLEALEWVRCEMMRRGSPDFIRQRELEHRVRVLAAKLARNRTPGRQTGSQRRKKPHQSE